MSVNRDRAWSVAEAKARLSEILRLAEQEGPQRIGLRQPFFVMPAAMWEANSSSRKPLGQWLLGNLPQGVDLESPSRVSQREIPFARKEQPPS